MRQTGYGLLLAALATAAAFIWLAQRNDAAAPEVGASDVPAASPLRPLPAKPAPAAATAAATAAPTKTAATATATAAAPAADAAAVTFQQRRSELDRRAQSGDAAAAAELGSLLATCVNYVGGTAQEMEDLVVSGMASGVEAPLLGGKPISPELLVLLLQSSLGELEARCRGAPGQIAHDQKRPALALLQRGADAGHVDAMVDYARYAFQDFADGDDMIVHADEVLQRKRRAAAYLEQAVARGNAAALQLRSEIRSRGGVLPRDSLAAYADAYAFSLTAEGRAWPARQRELYLAALAQPLDAARLAQAQQQGQALWQRCCSGAAR